MDRYQFDDVTKKALEELRAPLAVYQFLDKRVVTIILSDGFCDLFGFDDKDEAYFTMDNDMYEATHPDDKARIANEAFRFATEGGKYEVVYRTLTRSRTSYKIVHSIGEHVRTPEGVRLAYVWYTDEGTYTEETDHEQTSLAYAIGRALREESMINSSYFDYLTGLPSMSYFFELANAWRREKLPEGKTLAIVYMDLCGMKFFNRKHGFAEGDKLLRKLADTLKKNFSNENCSRFGSDHFCVFTEAEGLEDKLRDLYVSFRSDLTIPTLPVRAGICLDEDGDLDISTACDRAKYACDTMRNSYLSNFRYFSEEMLAQTESRQYIIDNIDRAISEKWIQVFYQPIVRAANGRVCDEEALARWIDPVKGMIMPSEFIPVLEEVNLIYKLDLYITEQILEKMKQQEKEGLYVVSESVNLSRADFNACDIVEEIRKRVDEAGVSRSKLNIEVTESTVGSDFDFMKDQIERFRSLGFPVWMDDFGSGYSSLDVLQSIRFDLIKFDKRFMKAFDDGDKSKIILTELIRMAISLGIDTICEGVETAEQADFLREVGCTMMQGYYFCRPIAMEAVFERYRKGIQIGFENPEESDYYAAIGKINLYDLAILSNEDHEAFEHYFNTLPMAIIESGTDDFMLIRCNNSYRTFLEKNYGTVPLGKRYSYSSGAGIARTGFLNTLRECADNGNKMLVDEELPDGSVAHSFLKRIAVNTVKGTKAVAIAVLAISGTKDAPMTFTHIAKALSADYIGLYYVNIKTNNFIEYSSARSFGELAVERHGNNFFDPDSNNVLRLICPEDQELFNNAFTKENILSSIDCHGAFSLGFRQLIDGVPTYVNLKAVRINTSADHIIIGINNVDAQMREKEALERMKQEHITYSRITALADNFICIYTVDPETDHYIEYSATEAFAALGVPKEGNDFFADSLDKAIELLYPDDLEQFRAEFSKEAMLRQIRKTGMFLLNYRLMLDGRPTPICMKAALVEESDGPQLIIGCTNDEPRKREADDHSGTMRR